MTAALCGRIDFALSLVTGGNRLALLGFESSGEEGSHSGLGAFPSWLSAHEIRKSRICNCKAKLKQCLCCSSANLAVPDVYGLDLDSLEIALIHSFIHSFPT